MILLAMLLRAPFEIKEAPAVVEDVEVKTLEIWDGVQFKADDEDGGGLIEGYASIFGEEDRVNDIVLKGAFAKTLKGRNLKRLPMLVGHVQRIPVGVWLEMVEDYRGLKVKGWIDTQSADGGQLHRILKKGAEIGISIGYRATTYEYQRDEKTNDMKRILKEVELHEVSLVTVPCCDGARVTKVKAAPTDTPEDIQQKAAIHEIGRQLDILHISKAIDRFAADLRV